MLTKFDVLSPKNLELVATIQSILFVKVLAVGQFHVDDGDVCGNVRVGRPLVLHTEKTNAPLQRRIKISHLGWMCNAHKKNQES